MDVWAPANSAGKSLPVLVWSYGGGFTGGSKAENTPEGLFNLTTDFVFVSYNYRLGMTGIANGPTLLHEGGISNTGIWDVQQAFAWTKKYISAFGGDADRITAMGFSAGASQVLFQTTASSHQQHQNVTPGMLLTHNSDSEVTQNRTLLRPMSLLQALFQEPVTTQPR